jgi:hypothetical protein
MLLASRLERPQRLVLESHRGVRESEVRRGATLRRVAGDVDRGPVRLDGVLGLAERHEAHAEVVERAPRVGVALRPCGLAVGLARLVVAPHVEQRTREPLLGLPRRVVAGFRECPAIRLDRVGVAGVGGERCPQVRQDDCALVVGLVLEPVAVDGRRVGIAA